TPKNGQSVSTWASVQKNLSYSYQVPCPSANARASGFKFNNTLGSDFAIVSDLNPGGEAVTKIAPTATKAEIKPANSRNHQGDGQNVLYADGHVDFLQSPFAGVQREGGYGDNIY